MKTAFRTLKDRTFTFLTGLSVVLMAAVLLIVLGPMIYRGSSAIFFTGTVEFRKMQLDLYGRGSQRQIEAELAEAEAVRSRVYEMIDRFKQGIDAEALTGRAKQIYRRFGTELEFNNIGGEEYRQLRSLARDIRKGLEKAFVAETKADMKENLRQVLQYEEDERLKDTEADEFFTLARQFRQLTEDIDFERRRDYAKALVEVEDAVTHLLGPGPGEALPVLKMHHYGATRWDIAEKALDDLLWAEQWKQLEAGEPLVKVRTPRAEQFASTKLEQLFPYIEQNVGKMLKPKSTFYWQYLIDDSTDGHYFGGVGPEILGTLLLTLLAMMFVVPLGIISAAYLVECSSESLMLRIIRMGINTLAGVPSIVFGLFGLAFFVLYLFPVLNLPSEPCILAASLTLALLTLPVMIRASEEAIRTVPQTYKEASLALGAGAFRTFVTVTLPAALPGILTGIILSLSRVAGETAPILFTGAFAFGSIPKSIFDQTRTLSYGSYDIAVGDRIAMMVPHKQYGMVVTLVLLILCLNGLAIVLRTKIFKRLSGQ